MDFSKYNKNAPKGDIKSVGVGSAVGSAGAVGSVSSSASGSAVHTPVLEHTGSLELYRGYVITTSDKKSLDKFKDVPRESLRTYEQVERLDNFAGVLATDTVLVDIDCMDDANRLFNLVKGVGLNCRVHTSRGGMHFLFKNTKRKAQTRTKWIMPLGIQTDIKVGHRNSLEILKVDGVERTVIYDSKNNGEYDEIPLWLVPYAKDGLLLGGLAEGSRNNTLFAYILTLQGIGFGKEEIIDIIKMINNYIIGEPLSSADIDLITRDEAFIQGSDTEEGAWFGPGNKFYFDKFANYLKLTYNIVKIDNQLFIYQNGCYVNGHETIEREMIKNISLLNKTKRNEVLAYLNLICDEVEVADPRYIGFANGVYDVVEGSLQGFSPEIILTNIIPFNYNPDALNPDIDKMITDLACNDSEIIKQIEEMVGMSFYRRNEIRGGVFLIIGDRQNGKSTFYDILNHLLGTRNVANLDLGALGEKFENTDLYMKLANIGDDIESEYIANTRAFKILSTGGALQVQNKGEKPFTFRFSGKLFFSANEIPRTNDRTGAAVSRMTIVPFKNKFNGDNPEYDPFIKYRIMKSTAAMERLIQRGLIGMKRVLANNCYTESESSKIERAEYIEYNNPIIGFFNLHTAEDFENNPTANAYMEYSTYCSSNNYKPLAATIFSKEVCKRYGLKTLPLKDSNRKTYRVFKRV